MGEMRRTFPNPNRSTFPGLLGIAILSGLAVSCGERGRQPESAAYGEGGGADPDVPSWSIQYEGKIVPRGKAYHIVDLFDVSESDLARLKADGTRPIAYFSSQYEDWRPDASVFPRAAIGKSLGGWEGENWIDTRSEAVRTIMKARLDYARTRGFFGVDIDNVDGYSSNTGFPYSTGDAVEWVQFLAAEAHARGLQFGLKNAVELIPAVNDAVDYYVNEEAHETGEIGAYKGLGKPVLNIEYTPLRKGTPGIYTIYKPNADMGAGEVIVPTRG